MILATHSYDGFELGLSLTSLGLTIHLGFVGISVLKRK
jgi:hypothetical protein